MELFNLTLTVVGGVSPSETVQLDTNCGGFHQVKLFNLTLTVWAGFHQVKLFNVTLTVVGGVSPSETVQLDTNCGVRGFTK